MAMVLRVRFVVKEGLKRLSWHITIRVASGPVSLVAATNITFHFSTVSMVTFVAER